jgi:hypothetical protein
VYVWVHFWSVQRRGPTGKRYKPSLSLVSFSDGGIFAEAASHAELSDSPPGEVQFDSESAESMGGGGRELLIPPILEGEGEEEVETSALDATYRALLSKDAGASGGRSRLVFSFLDRYLFHR